MCTGNCILIVTLNMERKLHRLKPNQITSLCLSGKYGFLHFYGSIPSSKWTQYMDVWELEVCSHEMVPTAVQLWNTSYGTPVMEVEQQKIRLADYNFHTPIFRWKLWYNFSEKRLIQQLVLMHCIVLYCVKMSDISGSSCLVKVKSIIIIWANWR